MNMKKIKQKQEWEEMKARYIGESFGVDSLTNGKIYTILGEDHDMYIVIAKVADGK